jgi:hypothetical protein
VRSRPPVHDPENLGDDGEGDFGGRLAAEVDGSVDAWVALGMKVLLVQVLEWEQSPPRSAATAGCYWFGFGC